MTIAIVCGKPEVESHERIVVERYAVTPSGSWKLVYEGQLNRTSERDANVYPGPQLRETVTCPMCGLRLERHGWKLASFFDRLAESGVAEVSLTALVARVT